MSISGFVIAGNDIASILSYWADLGVFDYVLPFLLIFALVYGILAKSGLLAGSDEASAKGVHAVIALAVGLLALQWGYVPDFFSRIFPLAGVGISILLVALILMGLFKGGAGSNGMSDKIFLGVGAVIAVVVIFSALGNYGGYGLSWGFGNWWQAYGPSLLILIVIGAVIALIVGKGGGSNPKLDAQGNPIR